MEHITPITYFINIHSEASDKIFRRRKGLLCTGLASDTAARAPQMGNFTGKVLPVHAIKK
jgi:hypothetical protein